MSLNFGGIRGGEMKGFFAILASDLIIFLRTPEHFNSNKDNI